MKNIANYAHGYWTKCIFLCFFVLLTACSPSTPQFASIDITGANYAKGFALQDATSKTRTLTEFKGKLVLIFFGFVQCPDVCPTTLTEMAEVKKLLGKDADRFQVVFVTVDPARDTQEVLKAYMSSFDSTFIALIPTESQLAALAKDFKVFYKRAAGPTATSYTMEHTANGYVFDTQGKIRLVARYGMGAKALAADLKQLL